MKRRAFLSNALTAAAATYSLGSQVTNTIPSSQESYRAVSAGAEIPTEQTQRRRVLRVAYLTDIHVKPDKVAEAGMAKALKSANALNPRPDFILNGGDSIMDALEKTREETQAQWATYKRILKAENSLPVVHTIGNHDIWGWFSKTNGLQTEKGYGKQWAVEELGLPKRYYAFERAGWKFIILDSVQLNPAGGYIAFLDQEQYTWLEAELKKTAPTTHICINSHIPILSMCAGLFYGKIEANGDLLTKRNLMHTDFFKLKTLFRNYPNIRLCLSGHIHLIDEVNYLGITYYCNGAVSGAWWKGAFQDFPPTYAVLDYFNDGSFERTFVNY
jgi:3',5'-cyclic AMP phosphodiesterase CpdA